LELVERQVPGDRVVGRAAAAQEPVGVGRPRDPDHQPPRRQRRAVHRVHAGRAEGDDALVGTERMADQPGAFEQAEQAALHGASRYSVGAVEHAKQEALAQAKARLDEVALYPRPVLLRGVRIWVAPWLFGLPWFRRFDGY